MDLLTVEGVRGGDSVKMGVRLAPRSVHSIQLTSCSYQLSQHGRRACWQELCSFLGMEVERIVWLQSYDLPQESTLQALVFPIAGCCHVLLKPRPIGHDKQSLRACIGGPWERFPQRSELSAGALSATLSTTLPGEDRSVLGSALEAKRSHSELDSRLVFYAFG